jgi:transcriptional regulator with XRE-family HTH domain
MDVGKQLKTIRMMKGMSQRELAKVSGVTNAMISQIEKNQVNPSVGSLKKILDAISMSMGEFFTMDIASEDKIFFGADELIDIGDGAISMLLVGGNKADKKVALLRETFPPGADTGEDLMQHLGEESGIVLRGEIELIVGHRSQILKAGDAYCFESNIPHRFRNKGKTECELISAATPPTF